MKKLMLGWLMVGLLPLTAGAAQVRITRFVYATPDGRIADLCGRVSPDIFRTVRIITDYDSVIPSTYTVQTDPRGEFCALVVTRYGRVRLVVDEVELFSTVENPM